MGRSWTQGSETKFAKLVADRKAQLRLEGHTASGSQENTPSTTTTSFSTSCMQEEPHGAASSCWRQPAAVPPSKQEGASSGRLGVGWTRSATLCWAKGVSCMAGGVCPTSAAPCPPSLRQVVLGLSPKKGQRGASVATPLHMHALLHPVPPATLALYCEGRSRSASP